MATTMTMTDSDRELLGLNRRDQSTFNAFMDFAEMIRKRKAMTDEERFQDWSVLVLESLKEKGHFLFPRLFIDHYNAALRKNGDKFEVYLSDWKAWQSLNDVPYPSLSKNRLNKTLYSFDNLEQVRDWVVSR